MVAAVTGTVFAEPLAPQPVAARPIPIRPIMRRNWVRWAVVIGLAMAAAGAVELWRVHSQNAIHYDTVAAEQGVIQASVTPTGTVNAVVDVQVGSEVSSITSVQSSAMPYRNTGRLTSSPQRGSPASAIRSCCEWGSAIRSTTFYIGDHQPRERREGVLCPGGENGTRGRGMDETKSECRFCGTARERADRVVAGALGYRGPLARSLTEADRAAAFNW